MRTIHFTRALTLLATLAAGAAPRLQAQAEPYPVILGLPASVRYAGLGGAGVGVIGDAGALFVNPSGIAAVQRWSFEGAYHHYADAATQAMGAAAVRVGQFDLGLGVHQLRFSDTAAARDNRMLVGTAVYRFGLIALGGSAKYVAVADSAGHTASAVSGDLGATVAFFDILALAVSVQNVGKWGAAGGGLQLPATTHLGATFNFVDPQGTLRLRGILESVWSQHVSRRTVLGLEAGIGVGQAALAARVGYGAQPEGSDASEFSYGATVRLRRVALDWAYQRHTVLGADAQRFGLRWTP
jgi:hypothetical protein